MRIQARIEILLLTPRLIFGPVTLPLTLAKGHEMRLVGGLEWSRYIDACRIAVVLASGRVGLARADRVTLGSNAVLDQAVHFVQLTRGDANGVLHDAPMSCVGAVVGACVE